MAEPSTELVKKIAQAIGAIKTNNSGVIGYSAPLRSELSTRLIELIASEAARVALDWLSKDNGNPK